MCKSLKSLKTLKIENSVKKSHKGVSLTRIKVGTLGSTLKCVKSNHWRIITCSFCIDEFNGAVMYVLLGYFYSFIRY